MVEDSRREPHGGGGAAGMVERLRTAGVREMKRLKAHLRKRWGALTRRAVEERRRCMRKRCIGRRGANIIVIRWRS